MVSVARQAASAPPFSSPAESAGRPSWDCVACGQPWPCDPAREALHSKMDRVALAIYMWERLDEAVFDLPPSPPAELFERYVKWTH